MNSESPKTGPHAAQTAPVDMQWHGQSVEESFCLLDTRRGGLTKNEVANRRDRHGSNVLEAEPARSRLAMLAAQFADLMVLILIGAAIISGVIGDLTDTLVIAAIVILNGILGFLQEYRAERAMAALKAMAAPATMVVREGGQDTVATAELVPGDVVILEAGSIVPADLRLVEAASLKVDESALTGESVPVDKHTDALSSAPLSVGDRHNIAHKGTVVTYGRAVGLVIATGMRTELGRVAKLLKEAHAAQTPLQRRFDAFGRQLSIVILLICAVVFGAGMLRGEAALPMLMIALSLAVAAIPEALPAVVGISLALGAKKMMAQRALIRRLPAVETLGSVTFICSDKTGTLTANQMRVEDYYCDGTRTTDPGGGPAAKQLRHAMAVSHDASRNSEGRVLGDPTEVALFLAAEAGGLNPAAEQVRTPRVAELPFDSTRKRMTTFHREPDGGFLSITKGAAEVVITLCDRELRGEVSKAFDVRALAAAADAMAADGLRVLAIAVRRWAALPAQLTSEAVENQLEFVGLVGLIDPPRPEVAEAIATCTSAGIVPVMITGDHPATARAVAQRLGLMHADGEVLTGAELASHSDADLARRVHSVRVYARVAPEQKLRIVRALQAAGEVVAMTGDGVNDAPALKRADIGISMGIAGTDVAKEAASMVLLDDNFATIVRAVREGRRIYDNLRHFVRYVLTTNSAEIWIIFLAPFLGLPVPLLPIQILWINLITDGLPGLALASEPAERDVMQRPPRPPTESLFARGLGAHALMMGLLMAGLVLGVEAWYWHSGAESWQTAVLTTLCFSQLAHVMAIRSERASLLALGLRSNRPLLGAVLLTIGLQLAIVYVPALSSLFKTVPLTASELLLCAACALVILVVAELEKAVRRGADARRGTNI